jgi:hypothetical protein
MNITPIATQDSNSAEKVKAAFQVVLTIHGDTPAQRAVVMAGADIGVIFHRQPQTLWPRSCARQHYGSSSPKVRRNVGLCTLPVALRGNAWVKTTECGNLYRAKLIAQCATTSSSDNVRPAFATTTARPT